MNDQNIEFGLEIKILEFVICNLSGALVWYKISSMFAVFTTKTRSVRPFNRILILTHYLLEMHNCASIVADI